MRTSRRGAMGHLCPVLRSRLAILVYQGSDPTPPYQALVIGQSAMLFFGFAPWGQSTLFGPRPGPASEGPPPLTMVILQDPPPVAPTPREAIRRSGEARDLASGSPTPTPRPTAPPRRHAHCRGAVSPPTPASLALAQPALHVHSKT